VYGVGMGSGMTGGPAAPPPVGNPGLPAPGGGPGAVAPWTDNKGPGLFLEALLYFVL